MQHAFFDSPEPSGISHWFAGALPPRPTVYIVEPEASLRASIARTVELAGWKPVVAASAEEFVTRPRVIAAGCLVVEQALPGMSGLDLQGRLTDRKELPVIFTSSEADIQTTVKAMKAGAFEFLTKPVNDAVLMHAIGSAIEHSTASLAEARRIHELRHYYQELSRREREVLRLVASGRLNKQVGFALGISEITVKAHRGSMMRKMHARSLAELVVMFADLPGDSAPCRAGDCA